jgi:hypothetical protein
MDPDWIRIQYWIRIRIGIQPKMLELDPDPDPDEMNADPNPALNDPEIGRGFIFTSSISLWKSISADGKGRRVTQTADRIILRWSC